MILPGEYGHLQALDTAPQSRSSDNADPPKRLTLSGEYSVRAVHWTRRPGQPAALRHVAGSEHSNAPWIEVMLDDILRGRRPAKAPTQ